MAKTPLVKDILDTALEREKKGHWFYVQASRTVTNEKGRQMFRWLATVEQTHIDKLTRQVDSLATTGKMASVAPEQKQNVQPSELPTAPAEASGKVAADTKELDALGLAMQAERDAIELYTRASRDLSEPDARALLTQLAADEQEHLDILEEEYEWLKRSGEYFTIHRFKLPAD